MNSIQILGFSAGPYQTNSYLVADGTRAFAVDPGMHAAQRFAALAEENGVVIEAIVLTHGHIDHCREAGDLAALLGVPVYIHPADAQCLDRGQGISQESRVLFGADDMVPIKDVRSLAADSLELIGHRFQLLHAPGHSPGSVIIVGAEFALTGDVLFKGSIGRTDLLGSDPQAMDRSLRGPVWGLDDSLMLLPGHGATTTMRAERVTNPFLTALGL